MLCYQRGYAISFAIKPLFYATFAICKAGIK